MASKKKLTIEDLMGMKGKRDKLVVKDVYVKGLNGTITLQKCSYNSVLNALDSIMAESNTSQVIEVFKELIYKCVPMFHNKELQKVYECVEPYDIVMELLDLGEIMEVGNEILKMYGLETLNDEVKN